MERNPMRTASAEGMAIANRRPAPAGGADCGSTAESATSKPASQVYQIPQFLDMVREFGVTIKN